MFLGCFLTPEKSETKNYFFKYFNYKCHWEWPPIKLVSSVITHPTAVLVTSTIRVDGEKIWVR